MTVKGGRQHAAATTRITALDKNDKNDKICGDKSDGNNDCSVR